MTGEFDESYIIPTYGWGDEFFCPPRIARRDGLTEVSTSFTLPVQNVPRDEAAMDCQPWTIKDYFWFLMMIGAVMFIAGCVFGLILLSGIAELRN